MKTNVAVMPLTTPAEGQASASLGATFKKSSYQRIAIPNTGPCVSTSYSNACPVFT
jgi:hypothetical protein